MSGMLPSCAPTYRLTALSRDATGGNKAEFKTLRQVISDMDKTWKALQSADNETKVQLADQLALPLKASGAAPSRVLR